MSLSDYPTYSLQVDGRTFEIQPSPLYAPSAIGAIWDDSRAITFAFLYDALTGEPEADLERIETSDYIIEQRVGAASQRVVRLHVQLKGLAQWPIASPQYRETIESALSRAAKVALDLNLKRAYTSPNALSAALQNNRQNIRAAMKKHWTELLTQPPVSAG